MTLNYTGRSGDVVAVAMSYDAANRYGLQTPFSETLSPLWKGSMWHADALHNALITMGNGGTEPTQAQMTLFYNHGQSKYRVEQKLVPGEQMWLNVSEAIGKQVPDSDSKTIPPDVMFGSYELRDLGHPVLGFLYEGKLIVDKTYGHASYGCAHCCGYSQARMSPTPFNGPPNIDNTDTYEAYSVCDSTWEDFDFFTTPYSSNTSVATMSVPTLHTVAPGGAQTSGKNELLEQGNLQSPCVRTNMPGTQGATVEQFNVAYSAYIPVDHISGPSYCYYQGQSNDLIYMGDANRGTYRVTESVYTEPDGSPKYWGFFPGTGQTRNYGAQSPKNGSTLSSLDEDGTANDCYVWNNSGQASTSTLLYDVSTPYAHQSQVHYDGSASNPLESQLGAIAWDMRVLIDTSNPATPTALVNYNHTCYPSHQIKVNGQVVYLYTPSRNDLAYLTYCLVSGLGKITGQQSVPMQVPPY